MEKVYGIRKKCAECGEEFFYCSQCWRGHKYCSPVCRNNSRRKKHRIAELKYSSTLKGKMNRSERQRRFRLKDKIVTDQSILRSQNSLFSVNKIKKNQCKCLNCNRRITNEINQTQDKLFFSFKIFVNYS